MVDCSIKDVIVVDPLGGTFEGDVGIEDGRICALGASVPGREEIDGRGQLCFPGIIDPHVHIGYFDPDDDYATESASAAVGGVTTFLTFVREVGDYREILPARIEAGEQRSALDFSFHVGMLTDAHLGTVSWIVEELGISSFKFYMGYKGEEGIRLGLVGCDDGFLLDGMSEVASYEHALAIVHAENAEIVDRRTRELQRNGADGVSAWSDARPPIAEAQDAARAIWFARETGARLQIAHISAGRVLDELRGQAVYAETCPHYLSCTRTQPLGNLGKVNPPLRDDADVEALWAAIRDGTIDTIGTDHAVIMSDRKQGDIWEAAPGIGPGMATSFPVCFSEGVVERGLPVELLARLMSLQPATQFGLAPRKGRIALGADADLFLVDPEQERVVRAAELRSAADFSVYEDRRLRGWPSLTMVRGKVVQQDGVPTPARGHGRFLRRGIEELS